MSKKFVQTLLLLTIVAGLGCVPIPRTPRLPLADVMVDVEPLLTERRYSDAVAALEEVAQRYPDAPQPFIRIGQIYLIQQRWLLAEDAFNRALARDLANPLAQAGLAEALFRQGEVLKAQQQWQQLVATRPEFPGGFTGLALTHLWLFDFEAARTALDQQQAHNFDPQAQWYLAALTAPHDLTGAVEQLQAIATEADETGVSAEIAAQRDYLLAALAQFSPASPQADVAKATGLALAQVEQWSLAAYALTLAKEQSQRADAETLAFLAYALARAGRPALELFEEARQSAPKSALPLFLEGLYLRDKGALQAAEASLQQALALDPENAAITVELARTNAQQGDLGTAESLYQAAVERAGGEPQFQKLLVEFYAGRSYRLEEAGIPAAEALVQMDEADAEAHAWLGWMQFLAGHPAAGETSLRQALELNPALVSGRFYLARLLEVQGQAEAAASEYRRVIDWDNSGEYRQLALAAMQRLNAP